MNKENIILGVVMIVLAVAIVGGYFYPKLQAIGTSTAGATFNTAKMAAISVAPINGATSTSILNPTGQDVYVTDSFIGCESATTTYTAVTGAGLASWNIKAATTSTNAPAVIANTNLAMNMNIATGTVAAGVASDYGGVVLQASSSIATSSPTPNAATTIGYRFIWAAGTYMTFWFNATSTATCTVGIHYFSS